MRRALTDPALFGSVVGGESWLAWRSLLIAFMGEELTAVEREVFKRLTGRESESLTRCEELWAVIGRRGGKTRAAAVLAAYLASCIDYSDVLAVGERGVIPFLAASQKQAAVGFNYVCGLFDTLPMLSGMVENRTTDTLALNNGIDIEIRPASFRTARGITAAAAIADEVAFWRSDTSANPDTEILNALRPSLATTGGPLIVISSPYSKRGELYSTYKRDFGPDGDSLILVAQGKSRDLNPLLSPRVIERAIERDESAARAEYFAEFRSDIENFISRDVAEAAVVEGRFELAPVSGVEYIGFCDPSGGSSDSFTLQLHTTLVKTSFLMLCVSGSRPSALTTL
jgi:hypothetical protein